uniref:Uncharacterized protein n=1 Tax=Anguilla anguilla TaxID=7936 RepID=A0A0E9RHM4_ANGAN
MFYSKHVWLRIPTKLPYLLYYFFSKIFYDFHPENLKPISNHKQSHKGNNTIQFIF